VEWKMLNNLLQCARLLEIDNHALPILFEIIKADEEVTPETNVTLLSWRNEPWQQTWARLELNSCWNTERRRDSFWRITCGKSHIVSTTFLTTNLGNIRQKQSQVHQSMTFESSI